MAWLSGWGKRIELKIEDYAGDIGASVTWFPITIFLKDANGDSTKVFLEVGANYKKIAITKADGTTELKGEIEGWNYDAGTPTDSTAFIHTSADGWTIDSNTSIFLYYDNTHADNDNIDVVNTVAGAAVWDGNFIGVWHLSESSGTLYDSTSNNLDGTAENSPTYIPLAKVDGGYNFDAGTERIKILDSDVLTGMGALTIEALIYRDTGPYETVLSKWKNPPYSYMLMVKDITNKIRFLLDTDVGLWKEHWGDGDVTVSAWHHIVGVYNGSNIKTYLDGTGDTTPTGITGNVANSVENIYLGAYWTGTTYGFKGTIDEVRISAIARSAAWLKGTYNSLMDSLFTYGSEEEEVTKILLTSTSVIVSSITNSLSRGVMEALTSTVNIVSSSTSRITKIINLISTSAIATSITAVLSRGITQILTSTANGITSITGNLSRGITEVLTSTVDITVSIIANLKSSIQLISTAVITSSITSSLSRGTKEALTSTSAITSSITGRLTKIIDLVSTSVIVMSITAVLSRGITNTLNSTSAITISITSVLSRGIKAVLNSTVNIITSITSTLSRGITETLVSTSVITSSLTGRLTRIMDLVSASAIAISITSVLSRGIAQALISTSAITTLITSSLSRGVKEVLTSAANIVVSIISKLSIYFKFLNATLSIDVNDSILAVGANGSDLSVSCNESSLSVYNDESALSINENKSILSIGE